jgi:hypothetical protein
MTTIPTAMSRRLITIGNAVIKIKVGAIPKAVHVVIFPSGDGRFAADASHGIKTDLQAGVYWVRDRVHNTPGDALDDAFSGFTQFYTAAVLQGFQPSETWLVQNPHLSRPPHPRRKQPSVAAPTKRRTKGKDRAARRR